MKKICDLIAHWMGLLVLLTAVAAFLWPTPFKAIPTWLVSPLLGLIMFGMGLTLSAKDFKIVVQRPKDILIGTVAQFVIMPGVAWLLSRAFGLSDELALGVILVGCCPGGTASNVITYLSGGDLALSVGMTATSTLLAPIVTPLLVLLLAGTMVDVDTVGMLLSILYVVIAPILLGLLCQRFLPRLSQRAVPYLPAFSSLVIMTVVTIVVANTADKLLSGGMLVILVVILHNLCGLGLGWFTAKLIGLSRPKQIAISIEVGMQNSGLATALAIAHFAAYPLATVPGAIFSVWHNISGALAANLFRRWRQD